MSCSFEPACGGFQPSFFHHPHLARAARAGNAEDLADLLARVIADHVEHRRREPAPVSSAAGGCRAPGSLTKAAANAGDDRNLAVEPLKPPPLKFRSPCSRGYGFRARSRKCARPGMTFRV